MPTENRSSNTEMVSVPRDKFEEALRIVGSYGFKEFAEEVRALLAQPAAQHQGEPLAEIVSFGEGLKEVAWRKGQMPEVGAKLYLHPPTSDGFSAGDMADQGAKAFRDGQRALVLPDRELYTKYLPGVIPSNAAEVNSYKDGWNACLDEVQRLNEAAIAPE